MKRLRYRVAAVFIPLVAIGIIGTALVTTRVFILDKRDYILELSSVAAPNIASAIGKQVANIKGQLAVLQDILKASQKSRASSDLVQSAFKKLGGVDRIAIYDRRGMFAEIGVHGKTGSSRTLSEDVFRELSATPDRYVFDAGPGGVIHLAVYVSGFMYDLRLSKDFFAEYFESSRALDVRIISSDAVVIAANKSTTGAKADPAVIGLAKASGGHAVIARQVTLADGGKILAALAPLPGGGGTTVVVQTPASMVSALVAQILKYSLVFVVFVLVFTLAAVLWFSARLVRPVEKLTAATGKIAAGQWKLGLEVERDDEIGRLVEAFNHMGGELEKREKELERAHEQILRNERLAVLGKFSAGVAHEVKNPLNAILGYAQLISRKIGTPLAPQDEETQKKFMGFIMDETRRASKIITELLTFARQKPPVLTAMPVVEAIRHASEMLGPQAQNAKVELAAEIADESMQADLDKDQVYQVVSNLVTNAFHALEEKNDGSPKVVIGLRRENGHALVSISDNGCGISPENMTKLFEPFFSTKKAGKGTGLGLSLCHGIVQQHGGKIEVKSELGRGTTFNIYLPIKG